MTTIRRRLTFWYTVALGVTAVAKPRVEDYR